MSRTMLMGAPSQMDDLFLPASFTPTSLAQELREDMEQDAAACTSNTSNTSTTTHPHPPPDSSSSSSPSSSLLTHPHPITDSYTSPDPSSSFHNHPHQHYHQPPVEDTTRILVDALVTTPTPTTRWYQASLTSVLVTVLVLGGVALGRGYIRLVLLWLQEEDVSVGLLIFSLLFFLISFPLFWGYALLLLAAGYLYGCARGPLVVLLCSSVALGAANSVMRGCCRSYFMDKLYSPKVQAILKVLNSPQGVRIVALTRLTPIPYGLQNALFSLSDMKQMSYILSSVAGLSPMAALYCYLGSTLRSMEDVLSDSSSHLTGYLILGGQMVFTAVLLCFVVRKARGELKKAMEQSTPGHSIPDPPTVVVD